MVLLRVIINGNEVCSVPEEEVPCEKTPVAQIRPHSVLELVDWQGVTHRHALGIAAGWCHLSVRVHQSLGCQADCIISDSETFDPEAFSKGKATGIRFQPFFVSGAKVRHEDLYGKGLFARGLHFAGSITPGNTVLSCECDRCKRSFQIRSFHAGFSNSGYFYSDSGRYTIAVGDHVAGCPVAMGEPDPLELEKLESTLPLAPDGTRYKYLNPFRCPHCDAPYIDFGAHPEERAGEYYGNFFVGSELQRYEPTSES